VLPTAPFSYRPLVPAVASVLPFDASTAINVVNVVALLAGLWAVVDLLRQSGVHHRYQMLGGAMWVASFPTFYYGAIGMTDPVLVAALAIGAAFIARRNLLGLALTIIIGAAIKETIVILLPVAAVDRWRRTTRTDRNPTSARVLGPLVPVALAYLVVVWGCRRLSVDRIPYFWVPSVERAIFNISRPRAWISSALGYGAPVVFTIVLAPRYLRDIDTGNGISLHALLCGSAMSFALLGYAVVAAYADGRFAWTSYPFTIPLSVLLLERWVAARVNVGSLQTRTSLAQAPQPRSPPPSTL